MIGNKILSELNRVRRRHKMTIPSDPRASDVYLVEFPKSGITWLSTLIANSSFIHSEMDERATFFNISQYIPDIHLCGRNVGDRLYLRPGFRFIKSHAEYNPHYHHSIYLVRHPASVIKSYYSYVSQRDGGNRRLSDFLSCGIYGIPAWKRHVNSWIRVNDQSSRVHLIRYEDLLSDTYHELSEINNNLGIGFSESTMRQAISISDVAAMKESEKLFSSRNPRHKIEFIKGERPSLTEEALEYINDNCVDELKMLGYVEAE
ncbi:MAG: sulfotransferase domain-containing protein [Candidatus Sedimenticola sp. 20ELBAFRAG]